MLEGCFRLDAVLRRQNEAQAIIKAFTCDSADGQWDQGTVGISSVSGKGRHQIEETDVAQTIHEYWKKEASSNTDTHAHRGSDILSELADTPEFSQHRLHMNLGRPEVHCGCTLAQD